MIFWIRNETETCTYKAQKKKIFSCTISADLLWGRRLPEFITWLQLNECNWFNQYFFF